MKARSIAWLLHFCVDKILQHPLDTIFRDVERHGIFECAKICDLISKNRDTNYGKTIPVEMKVALYFLGVNTLQ